MSSKTLFFVEFCIQYHNRKKSDTLPFIMQDCQNKALVLFYFEMKGSTFNPVLNNIDKKW